MNIAQVQQMITTLGIDQETIMKYLQEHSEELLSMEIQGIKQPILDLFNDPDFNVYQKLQMSSPLVNTHRDVTYATESVQLHSHSFYELLYCESGEIQYLISNERYSIRSGDIILVPPGISHRPIFYDEFKEPYSRIVLWVSPEFIQDLTKNFPDVEEQKKHLHNHYLLRTDKTEFNYLKKLFLRGAEESSKKQFGWESALYYNTGILLTEIYRIMITHKPSLAKEEEDELDKIISFVESNYSSHISMDETAKHFLISKSTLSKLFQNRLGISFYRFVTQRRLINAKLRIEAGESLDKLGVSCGFNDYATFYRAFKKEYGLSPREYQKLTAQQKIG